ncbi:MAG TPA: hypothetical protein VN285_09820 [Candidatus Deferrimicrobium sp.]|nr:hypothetical protein [Candidatus Deferrimicrobium sp.]
MAAPETPKSYSDIRGLVPVEIFTQTMNFLAWHNRQTMTPMLEVWEALVVAFALQQHTIDQMQYPAVKTFFRERPGETPDSEDACRSMAESLHRYLSGTAS